MDGFPIPITRGARSFHPGWLADIARVGKGGNDRYFYGVRMMMVISGSGVATGWALALGNVQERWVAEMLFSTRAGRPQLQGPIDPKTHTSWGLLTRVAAYNLGILMNWLFGRPDFAFATLIV